MSISHVIYIGDTHIENGISTSKVLVKSYDLRIILAAIAYKSKEEHTGNIYHQYIYLYSTYHYR